MLSYASDVVENSKNLFLLVLFSQTAGENIKQLSLKCDMHDNDVKCDTIAFILYIIFSILVEDCQEAYFAVFFREQA